jgi:hypothetical protein
MSDCETSGLIAFLIFVVYCFGFPYVWMKLEEK